MDDGVGLLFEGEELADVVSSRPAAGAMRVNRERDGAVNEGQYRCDGRRADRARR